MNLEEKILNALNESEQLKAGEIAEKVSEDKKEVDKIIKKLKADGKITSPKRCYYAISK